MRTQLQIGEIAQLLGVTPKTIRHYQKVGLLAESERTEAGYRLYTAQDLLRLHRIRRLQAFGLSLKQISTVLGEPKQDQTLRDVLQALDEELATHIQVLEERRTKIKTLLEEKQFDSIEQLPVDSPSFQFVKKQLAPYHSQMSTHFWEQEAQLYAVLDNFQWTPEQQSEVQKMAQVAIEHFTQHPEEYQELLALGERFVTIAFCSEGAPELQQLADDFVAYFKQYPFMMTIQQQIPAIEAPFSQVFSDLVTPIYSPAQAQVLKLMVQKFTNGGTA